MLTQAQFLSFDRSEDPLTLHHWHELHVSRTAKNGILQVDQQKVVQGMAEVRRPQCAADGEWAQVLETEVQWLRTRSRGARLPKLKPKLPLSKSLIFSVPAL